MSASRRVRPWAFLTPDLLIGVSGRLHDASDFVRFHAVCTSWRDLHTTATRPKFLPWILTESYGQIMHSPVTNFERGDSSSKVVSSHRGERNNVIIESAADDRSWVASVDGSAVWLFTDSPKPRLVDLVTGTCKPLPPFPDGIKRRLRRPHGIVYGDGTVFLYSFTNKDYFYTAAILRPNDGAWTVLRNQINVSADHNSCAAYHDGKVLVCPSLYWSCVLTPDFQPNTRHDTAASQITLLEDRQRYYVCCRYYVLESRGEFLRVSLFMGHDWDYYPYDGDLSPALSVLVHALEGAGGEMRWVVRSGWSLADRVLFLGCNASFAADASQLGIRGGHAYFVFRGRVFRISIAVDGETKAMKLLRSGWDSSVGWLRPEPTISPIEKIRQNLGAQSKQEDGKN